MSLRSRRIETAEEEPEGPMRILQIAHYTLPDYGGIKVAVESLAQQMA
jgi:hypothetical protein